MMIPREHCLNVSGLAMQPMNRLDKIWKDHSISLKHKIRLYKAIVLPTVLYGAESWVLRKKEKSKLMTFETSCLRRVCGVRRRDRIRNEEI